MSDSQLEDLLARIEATIEDGGLDEARRLIADAEARLGARPELGELRQRLSVVDQALSGRVSIDAAIRRAREDMNRADYPSALAVLQSALEVDPSDPALREMLQLTSKAALRHDAAVERNRVVAEAAERIGELIAHDQLDAASTELREANLRFGKHTTLLALGERLDERCREVDLERTVAHVDQARAFLDAGNWQAAMQQADRVLRADPKNDEARHVKGKARAEIEHQEADRQAAGRDVERLIRAAELPRAGRALRAAQDRLGRHEVFAELERQLDRAKADLQARKRLEWTQRRLKEAEDLVRRAGRLLLQGQHEEAIRRLNQARELHPEHAEIEGLLQAAHTGRRRAGAERRRSEALQAAKAEIRHQLDALRLEAADAGLEAARSRFGDDSDFEALRTRLEGLRQAENAAAVRAAHPTADGSPADESASAAAVERQQVLAAAYSFKQILLYAFRDRGAKVFGGLLTAVVVLDALSYVPGVGGFFGGLRWLIPIAASGWLLEIVRETLRGHNTFPAPTALLAHLELRVRDLALVLSLLLLAAAPLAALLLTRGWHTLFSGASGWLLSAAFGWWAAAFIVLAASAAGAFGARQSFHVGRHLRALNTCEPDTFLAVNLVFVVFGLVLILRAALLPIVPWLGSPLAGAVEIYALMSLPHALGVMVRRHRIELRRIYRSRPHAKLAPSGQAAETTR